MLCDTAIGGEVVEKGGLDKVTGRDHRRRDGRGSGWGASNVAEADLGRQLIDSIRTAKQAITVAAPDGGRATIRVQVV